MPERRVRQRLSSLALALVVVCVVAGLVVGDHLAQHATALESSAGITAELQRERTLLWVCALGALSALVLALVHERSQARRIADRSDELERLSVELLRANRVKSEFLANVSHELRTPLAAVVGFIDLLRDGAYGELAPRQVAPVERIESSANHLCELVDRILDLSKLAAGRLEVSTESLSLRAFVIDVASEVESLLNEKGLSFSISVPSTLPKVETDPTHLRQILVNLFGNAIKFTDAGAITVRAVHVADGSVARVAAGSRRRPLLAEWGAFVALQVSDTGTGIAEKDQERIFEEFEQVDAGPRGDSMRRGTGLGLSISRRLARLLGGDITVESELGVGSTFTVWLPFDVVEPRAVELRAIERA
ncbi:MAG TPA: ATP-binding protein [Gemmatimonadaceae bacterium]